MAKTSLRACPPELHRRAPELARALAEWFAANARELSFRATRDPYAIWVSEVMAQQTQVATVERYFSRFLARFPDVQTLASASQDEVLAAWSGLGYYRRARLLHQGAQHVAEELGGVLPDDATGLQNIPGIGPYTAGAIASIAFDQPAPLVDGNVARVLSRLQGIREPAEQDAKAKAHWQAVAEILRHQSPRQVSQALMELGAVVCTPRAPKCEACPLRAQCVAFAEGTTGQIPAAKVRAASPTQAWWGVVLRWRQRYWLEQRPAEGLLASMWMVPLLSRRAQAKAPSAAALRELFPGLESAYQVAGSTVRHVFSHRIWEVAVWLIECSEKAGKPTMDRSGHWYGLDDELPGGLPTLSRKVLESAAKSASNEFKNSQ